MYVIRVPVPADVSTADMVTAYKQFAHVERDFRGLEAEDWTYD